MAYTEFICRGGSKCTNQKEKPNWHCVSNTNQLAGYSRKTNRIICEETIWENQHFLYTHNRPFGFDADRFQTPKCDKDLALAIITQTAHQPKQPSLKHSAQFGLLAMCCPIAESHLRLGCCNKMNKNWHCFYCRNYSKKLEFVWMVTWEVKPRLGGSHRLTSLFAQSRKQIHWSIDWWKRTKSVALVLSLLMKCTWLEMDIEDIYLNLCCQRYDFYKVSYFIFRCFYFYVSMSAKTAIFRTILFSVLKAFCSPKIKGKRNFSKDKF